ncbi:MAG: glycine--tRNA ligase subunit beta [Aquificaceae bacterium]
MDLLIEIGTEELPARVINPLLEYLKGSLGELLRREDAKVYGTPRRLALYYENFENVSMEEKEVIIGPPLSLAYDEHGRATKALAGFLQRVSASEKEIFHIEKGDALYVAVKRVRSGRKPLELLTESFEGILLSAPIPKSMRWDNSGVRFSRPIRWICSLYGTDVVPLRFGKVVADRRTQGHRFLSTGWIELMSASEYEKKLKDSYVIPNFKERLSLIHSFLKEESYRLNGTVEYPEGLVEEVANLVEFPFALVGQFDSKYLELPEKVTVTVLAHHQRFFCIRKKEGLLPNFIAISGNIPKDSLIVRGYEKVIKARLEDALFFYKEDMKKRFEELVKKLSHVLFHPKAGSMLEKTERIMHLSEYLSDQLLLDEGLKKKIRRAAYLSKADILTEMVREFDELQGYMGYVYAKKQGEDEDVALSLYEYYFPKSPSDPLPSNTIGLVLSLSDKIDDLVILIKYGEIPSGSSDPYGLRRCAYGIFSILDAARWNIDLQEIIKKQYGDIPLQLEGFLRSRLEAYLEPYGYDVVRSVLEVGDVLKPLECIDLVREIANLKEEQKFKDIVSTYRRVVRIMPKEWQDDRVEEALLITEEETALWEEIKRQRIRSIVDLYSIKEPVDKFFDKVLVMEKDENIRRNRLALLFNVKKTFNKFADFNKLVYEGI